MKVYWRRVRVPDEGLLADEGIDDVLGYLMKDWRRVRVPDEGLLATC